jgi:hypothetical protein
VAEEKKAEKPEKTIKREAKKEGKKTINNFLQPLHKTQDNTKNIIFAKKYAKICTKKYAKII